MALNDNATLVIGAGNYFVAPTGTALPVDLDTISTPWENIGHTSIEDIISQTSEGGEATVLATLQNSALRTTYSKRSESFAITLQQFDEDSLKLYFGSNMATTGDGLLGVPDAPAPTEQAFLAVYVDGDNIFAIYAPKAEFYRGDDFSFADGESLAGLPISITPLKNGANSWAYAVTPLDAA